MKHLDLFSGIGGFAYAIDQVWDGVEHIFCEIDPFCQKILKKHWTHSKIYGDIKKIKGQEIGTVDIVTGGFPCQPFSQARTKSRKGTADERYLWKEMLRVITEVKPSYIVGENVYGILTWDRGMVVETIISDLEDIGYEIVPPIIIPASSIGAVHKRRRVWFIAHAKGKRRNKMDEKQEIRCSKEYLKGFDEVWRFGSELYLALERNFDNPSSGVWRNDDGLSEGVDRLKALGNAIVPQVATEIFKAIKDVGYETIDT